MRHEFKRVLLVTAHPDDEAMFFAPTLLTLFELGVPVKLLCLSTGNAKGMGTVRSQELVNACKYLGIADKDIVIIDDKYSPHSVHV